jgi:hypothetical protein
MFDQSPATTLALSVGYIKEADLVNLIGWRLKLRRRGLNQPRRRALSR